MVGRGIAVLLLALMLLGALALPSMAVSNSRASCVGIIVSNTAPPDVRGFKALAEAGGAPNFGAFVSGGARVHFGSVAACFP